MQRTTRQRRALAVAALLGAAAPPVHAESFTEWAPVVRVTPIYTHVSEPRQQCWVERVTTNEYVDARGVPLGAIVGGITGGVIGSQAGSGYGRDAATIGGAVAGAAIGDAIDRERAGIEVAPVTRDVERCRTIDVGNDVVQGYDVTYRYRNREFTTRLAYDPGQRVQVNVDVQPTVQ
jgi:uncharacterized protein YcfJ